MKKMIRKIALERIKTLFDLAERYYLSNKELSKRYLQIAKRISMKSNTPIPKKLKRKYCRKCYNFLIPGKSAKVRIDSKKKVVEYTCLECGRIYRYGYSKEKKIRNYEAKKTAR